MGNTAPKNNFVNGRAGKKGANEMRVVDFILYFFFDALGLNRVLVALIHRRGAAGLHREIKNNLRMRVIEKDDK